MTWGIGSLQKGLVGHWRLDEQSFNPATKRFTDKSAYSNHGTGNGTQLGSATPGFQADHMGQLVRAAPFNGSDDYINCGNGTICSPTMTVEMWVKWNNLIDTQFQFINTDTDVKNFFYHALDINNFAVGWRYDDAGVDQRIFLSHSGILTAEKWHNISAIIDSVGGTHKIYVDGIEKYSTTKTYTIGVIETPTYIGRSATAPLNGSISEVHIYNRVLSQQEITLLYESYRT